MLTAEFLATRFVEGDRPFRPRRLTQVWVVNLVRGDALRAVEVHDVLVSRHGTHAATKFRIMLEQATRKSPFYLWFHTILAQRVFVPLPS